MHESSSFIRLCITTIQFLLWWFHQVVGRRTYQ
jgi:hypothetical protein